MSMQRAQFQMPVGKLKSPAVFGQQQATSTSSEPKPKTSNVQTQPAAGKFSVSTKQQTPTTEPPKPLGKFNLAKPTITVPKSEAPAARQPPAPSVAAGGQGIGAKPAPTAVSVTQAPAQKGIGPSTDSAPAVPQPQTTAGIGGNKSTPPVTTTQKAAGPSTSSAPAVQQPQTSPPQSQSAEIGGNKSNFGAKTTSTPPVTPAQKASATTRVNAVLTSPQTSTTGRPATIRSPTATASVPETRAAAELPLRSPPQVELQPNSQLVFRGVYSEGIVSRVRICNKSSTERVCFKVKTNAPPYYNVQPSCDVIDPLDTSDVTVYLQATPGGERPDRDGQHKFMIQSICVPAGPISSLEKLWQQARPAEIASSKLVCVFEQHQQQPNYASNFEGRQYREVPSATSKSKLDETRQTSSKFVWIIALSILVALIALGAYHVHIRQLRAMADDDSDED